MLERIRRAVVESYIGAVALGYLLAQAIIHFVDIFSTPIAELVARREYSGIISHPSLSDRFPYVAALPQLISFLVLLLVWYVLLRWLYFKPLRHEPQGAVVEAEADFASER